MEMALIENIQREDLNAIEIALTYQKLMEQYGLTQEKLSERVGKNRSTITNFLRLLKLPAEIQIGLKNRLIDNGHARALLPLSDPEAQLAIYEEVLKNNYSVRAVEDMVRNFLAGEASLEKKGGINKPKLPEEYNLLKSHLSKFFNTKIQFTCNDKGKGKISIPFKSEEELERIIGIFDKLQD
jgi:ParB-like partition proteins